MTANFSDVSKKIIDESIEKVLYVDDEIALPFVDDDSHSQFRFCSELFNSFKENNSIVDFYKFSDISKWSEKKDFFRGTDLLILDWKLDRMKGFGFESTLKILDKAIKTDSLHFVNIYSSEPEAELQKIPFYINAYYSKISTEKSKEINQKIEDFINTKGIQKDEFIDKLKDYTFQLNVSNKNDSGKAFSKIKLWIKEEHESEAKEFEELLMECFGVDKEFECYSNLAFVLNDVILGSGENFNLSSNLTSENFLFLNHTIIQISKKETRLPANFYEFFREAIIGSTKNFVTIMGLEMRNRFKKNSAFIGKDIDQISDLAFFFHKEHNQNSESAFYNFLKNIWKDQASSFLYSTGMELEIFTVLDDYKKDNDIDTKIEEGKKDSKFDKDLALLNYYYNRLRVNRKEDDKIKFGDVFSTNGDNSKFFLCITAHCDCLYPSNINNSFFFVEGEKMGINSGLKKGDSGFTSFLIDQSRDPFVINWKEKPFTVYIDDGNNVVGNDIQVNIHGDEKVLKYFATIKDNYTQRIANNALSHPLRVGVYFADRKDLLPKESEE